MPQNFFRSPCVFFLTQKNFGKVQKSTLLLLILCKSQLCSLFHERMMMLLLMIAWWWLVTFTFFNFFQKKTLLTMFGNILLWISNKKNRSCFEQSSGICFCSWMMMMMLLLMILAQTVFVYLCICICIFWCQTPGNIVFEVLKQYPFQKYSTW